jgi:hypothetical protein
VATLSINCPEEVSANRLLKFGAGNGHVNYEKFMVTEISGVVTEI